MRQQLHQLQQKLAEANERQLRQLLAAHREEIERITRERDKRERQRLESSEQERIKLEKQLHELEEQLLAWRDQAKVPQHVEAAGSKVVKRGNIKLRWRNGGMALFAKKRWCDAIVDGNEVYFLDGNSHIWTYDISKQCYSTLLDAPYICSSLVVLNSLPTIIGGSPPTNKLMSLATEGKWTEIFPPMPTKRGSVTAVLTGTVLIVAGGLGENLKKLTIVEVLNIENLQWSTAIDLPESLQYHSATVCGDQLYMLGGGYVRSHSAYTCSVSALLQTCTQRSLVGTLNSAPSLSGSSSGGSGVWSKLPDLPVTQSTCVTFCGQLLAVGGEDSDLKPTTAVYTYNQATNSWSVISHMATAKERPFAAVLPDNQLMVVGGQSKNWTDSDSVEFGNLC